MEDNQYHLMFENEDTHWWFLAKREFIKSQLPRSNPNWKILDLGCGTGGLSKYLTRYGKVTRIEKSTVAITYLNRRGLDFTAADINTVDHPKQTYDVICLFDVLYHKGIDDEMVLKNAFSMLKKGGIVLITDSAVSWLTSHHDEENMARERYNLSEIVQKVQSAGFSVKKKSYIYFIVFPIFFVSRLLGKFIKFENLGKTNALLDQALFNLCKIEANLLTHMNFPIGSSVLVKAQKN
jgi:2-polyprenyl-3-methyl-5-hydroxy-6-metoxy-1,4-benzoquinol methylase